MNHPAPLIPALENSKKVVKSWRRLIRFGIVLSLAATILIAVHHEVGSGAEFLLLAATNSEISADEISEQELSIRNGDRELVLRVYRPRGGFERTVLIAHGVHYLGIHDERFMDFCRRIAQAGFAVVTPDLEDLKSYDLKGRSVFDLQTAGKWILGQPDLMASADDGKFSMMGISFGGGMALSAAALPDLRDKVSAVFSFGGHGDLDRTISYLVTGEGEDGPGSPHVYGQAVLMRKLAPRLVPASEIEDFRAALDAYLQGREDEVIDQLENCGTATGQLLDHCLERRASVLAEKLSPLIRKGEFDKILSPVQGPVPACPVFLLHGARDNVVPPSEARAVQQWVRSSTQVEAIISEQVIHVEFSDDLPSPGEVWALASFLTSFLES